MSYYRPSFSQTLAMSRGRGGYSPRGSSYRGNSRGHRGSYSSPRGFSSFDSRSKYNSSERYSGSRNHKFDEYRKPFRSESYSSRDRSPERKKPRIEGYSSRHDNYSSSGGRYESSFTDRRSYSGDRSVSYPSRKEEFRKPSGPPRGSYRGRGNSRGSRILRPRERMPPRRRMIESSYGVRKRMLSSRANDYTRRLKISKLRSAIAARRANRSDAEGSDGEDEKKESDKEENDEEMSEKTVKKEEPEEKDHGEDRPQKILIKLRCPHCHIRCITFRKYEIHLSSRNHMMTMKRVVIKQKAILMQMRQAQRTAQNELEKSSGGEDLTSRTNFCPVCQLNYKQKKSVHQTSEAHKNMKKFVMPFCKICSITFKNRMGFESHCCSIEHLKRKQRMENDASEESNEEADLENFTTIDSVGDVDEEESEKKEETKEILNVGIENILKVEAYYCELCKTYLPKVEDSEWPKTLAKHCKLLGHMKRYVQYKEDKELEERAKKLQKRETAEKEEKAKKGKDDDQSKSSKSVKMEIDDSDALNKSVDEDENKDDKMWADVDKDLGDILADAEDDDEEESNLKSKERYDRFKLSEKNGEEKNKDEKAGETSSNGQTEDAKKDN